MNVFPWQNKKEFFPKEEQDRIVSAIQTAEQTTSGEVRVFVESKCSYVDALDRAKEIFFDLKMNNTALRNAVLVYVATADRQVAVFADEGIHAKTGQAYWEEQLTVMLRLFKQHQVVDGIVKAILHIGDALQTHFPYDRVTDKNELPDDIVFGK